MRGQPLGEATEEGGEDGRPCVESKKRLFVVFAIAILHRLPSFPRPVHLPDDGRLTALVRVRAWVRCEGGEAYPYGAGRTGRPDGIGPVPIRVGR